MVQFLRFLERMGMIRKSCVVIAGGDDWTIEDVLVIASKGARVVLSEDREPGLCPILRGATRAYMG